MTYVLQNQTHNKAGQGLGASEFNIELGSPQHFTEAPIAYARVAGRPWRPRGAGSGEQTDPAGIDRRVNIL